MKKYVRFLLGMVAVCALSLAQAQTYPARPIMMIVPLQAGSSLDVVIRIVAQKMSEGLGQTIVIENQAGAAGAIGAERVMRATPDGYTIAAFNDAVLTMVPNLRKNIAYDPLKSFAPVSLMGNNSWVLVAHPNLAAKSVAELIALAKAKPGELNYSSGGQGSPQHIAMELFQSLAGIKMTHVPYKGTTQATLDVISGQIPMMFSGTNAVLPQVREGKLRALGAGSGRRQPLLPGVPTVAEAGVPGYEFVTWFGLFTPLNTPKDIIARLHAELSRALAAPDVREKLVAQGIEIETSTPEQLSALTNSRLEQMGKLIRAAGVVIE
jgi:tripartite-type tricarboxylate transporter receptor subunit TctC